LIYVQQTEEIFSRGKNEVTEDGIQHIKDRLTNTSTNNVAKAMSVFETFMWPRQKLESLGDGIAVLFNHYRPLICETKKENVEDLTDKVLSQWYEYGICTSANHDTLAKATLPFYLNLLPIFTSSYERGVHLNLITTKLRSSSESKNLSTFMMINLNGLPMVEYEYEVVLQRKIHKTQCRIQRSNYLGVLRVCVLS
jgi:hypothetical protein